MFVSKCLVSKKGSLGAIWVAAYFYKKLKKAQVFQTNIPSSVDNILQDQLEILAYRVLAYLLLGIVRIYSKKVEYLLDDCQEVQVKINEFVVREKNRAKKKALHATFFSITRPMSFDLDAFDLEILEDTTRDNVVPLEQITLKDVPWKNAEIRQYSLERFAALDDDLLMDYTPTEDSLSCHPMDFETKASTSQDVCNLEASMEKLRYDKSFHEEVSLLKTVSRDEEEPPGLVKFFDKIDREHVELPDLACLEHCMDKEASREKYSDTFLNLQNEDEEDPLSPLQPLAEDRANGKMMKGLDLSASENEMHQAMEEDHEIILEGSTEIPDIAGSENRMEREARRQNCNGRFFSKVGVSLPSEAEEEPLSPVESLGENQANREKMRGRDLPQPENEVCLFMEEDHVSILEGSAEVPDIADLGATTPQFKLIQTPATKEPAPFPRKRKRLFDDMIVFPNGMLKQWIKDASDLVSKRGKGDPTALAARKTHCISNLPQSFFEPSVPCALELKTLFCGKRLIHPESVKIIKPPEKIDNLESPAVDGCFEQADIALETVGIRDLPNELNSSQCPPFDGSSEQAGIAPQTPRQLSPSLFVGEQTEIAPGTPVLHSKLVSQSLSPENLNCDDIDEVGAANMDCSQSIEKEPYLNEIVEEEPSQSEIVEKEPSQREDKELDLDLGSEEIHSNEDDNQGQDGWSTRTRMVAKNLQRFLDQRKRGEKEKVKLSQLLKGKTKEASARLFYEMLVLKSKGVVDVKQDTAFGDILVLKGPEWDHNLHN
ncbi:hypothetical protein PTKIN_Ptkin01aG0002100 [Pterospermum kingtungense]